jgi:hypothetical protein
VDFLVGDNSSHLARPRVQLGRNRGGEDSKHEAADGPTSTLSRRGGGSGSGRRRARRTVSSSGHRRLTSTPCSSPSIADVSPVDGDGAAISPHSDGSAQRRRKGRRRQRHLAPPLDPRQARGQDPNGRVERSDSMVSDGTVYLSVATVLARNHLHEAGTIAPPPSSDNGSPSRQQLLGRRRRPTGDLDGRSPTPSGEMQKHFSHGISNRNGSASPRLILVECGSGHGDRMS